MCKQIVVGVDEHQGGRDAIALAKKLLARDGELTLAYVYAGDPHVYRSASAAYEASEHERAREMLERTREETGIQAHLRWRGSPSVGQGLHELCEAIGADLLIVGSSRRGLLGRVLMGDDPLCPERRPVRDRDRAGWLLATARRDARDRCRVQRLTRERARRGGRQGDRRSVRRQAFGV